MELDLISTFARLTRWNEPEAEPALAFTVPALTRSHTVRKDVEDSVEQAQTHESQDFATAFLGLGPTPPRMYFKRAALR
ncbi:hypothetical protein ACVIGB_000508 [Bradyrhizobium sp. USDA 4341]